MYKAHRLIWLYVNGYFPKEQIDYINRVKTDNRISNLREVSNRENSLNHPLNKNNKSGTCGVHWDKSGKVWLP